MLPILRKISLRKIRNEKGRSFCVMLAIFLTTVLFILVFSGVFFVKDAFDELARSSASWTADAAFMITEEQYEKIRGSHLVAEASVGQHIGEILNSGGYVEIELASYEEKIAHWMKCYPSVGRLPEKGKEIVVSAQYLENLKMTYEENQPIDITYSVDGEEYTDTFTLVGTYDRELQSKNMMLLSADYYHQVSARLEEQGKDSRKILYNMAEVKYRSSRNIERETYRLMDEIEFDIDQGYMLNNNFSGSNTFGSGIYAVIVTLVVFIILIGYLFISNIFSISMSQDIKFYGKLSTNGITEAEIRKIILLQYNILYLLSVIPAMVVGYIFTSMTLPGILSSFFTFQVKNHGNCLIFILAAVFSYVTLLISAGKSVKIAGKVSPTSRKKFFVQLRPVRKSDNRSCLNKFVLRKLQNDRKNAMKIYAAIAIGILLANLFYTIVNGFDEKTYIGSDLAADYTIAKTTFYSQADTRARENLSMTELSACNELPGLKESGGGAVSRANIIMDARAAREYEEITRDENLNNEYGEMLTFVYGLDDIMIRKMTVLDGNIDLDAYKSGRYVIIDALDDDGNTCFHVGDTITVPFQNGNTGTYTVMAIAELPYAISYQSKWVASSNLFLPRTEWSRQTQSSDYYMYTYDIEAEYQEQWDAVLAGVINANHTLQYKSAKTMADDNREFLNGIKTVGFVLSVILFSMGIMNFVNCMATGVYSRRKEFAIMQSMGTTRIEIITALMIEGLLSIMGGFAIGCMVSIPGIYVLIDKVLAEPYMKYQFYPMLYLLFAAAGIITAFLVPCISYFHMDKKEAFLKRIRSCRE